MRTLFAVAGVMQPSVIFIDEIDSLMSARKSDGACGGGPVSFETQPGEARRPAADVVHASMHKPPTQPTPIQPNQPKGEHEASRRLKTEILVQMEGCDPSSSSRRVLLIGATNRPEELDEAARRRMPKQLYIPLPCAEARRQMIVRQLGPGGAVAADLGEVDLGKVVEKTDVSAFVPWASLLLHRQWFVSTARRPVCVLHQPHAPPGPTPQGYSGSDMRNLIQEACQGPVREAVVAAGGDRIAQLRGEDLRPVRVRDFQLAAKVGWQLRGMFAL